MKTKKDNTIEDVAQALRSMASLCRHGLLCPEPHDFDDYADRLENYANRIEFEKRGRTVYVLTEIDKTNHQCTEPQDVHNWVFSSTAAARKKMKELYNRAPDQETNEIGMWSAFKNSDDYEIQWVIRRAKIDEG